MLKRIYISLLIVLFIPGLVLAQDKYKDSRLFKTAKKDYQDLKYASAIREFQLFLNDHPADTAAMAMLADSYHTILDYNNAAAWYNKLTSVPGITLQIEWALQYARVLANLGQYHQSGEWYTRYAQLKGGDSVAEGFARLYADMKDLYANSKEWKVNYLNLNTLTSEFSPMYYKNGLMFTSNRKTGGISKYVFEWDETPFCDLYYVENLSEIKAVNPDSIRQALKKQYKDSGKKPYRVNDDDTYATSNDSKIVGVYNTKFLKDTLGDYLSGLITVKAVPGKINSKFHEGTSALLPNGDIIFNRNNYYKGKYSKSKEGINKLKLFIAKAPDYTDITPFPYNNDQYSIGHPAVNSKGTLLIFASDMPGGYGQSDLYYSKRASVNDNWDKPVNMGKVINTSGNEQFPTLYQDSILYFSSNGHPGMGGLDIFKITLSYTVPVNKPVNIGVPINSSVDDFGLITDDKGFSGFFTSNRKGSDDIYSYVFKPYQIQLKGLAVDADNGQAISNTLVAVTPGGQANLLTDNAGVFNGTLKKDLDYTVTASKAGYTGSQVLLSTRNIVSDTTLNVVLKLKATQPEVKNPQLAKTPSCDSLKLLIAIRKIYYKLNKAFIRRDARPELANLLDVLNQHAELKVIVASYCDTRGSVRYNMALSRRRSLSAKAYLIKHGVKAGRIKMEYFGKNRLVNKCNGLTPCTEAEHQLNRRTEFILLSNGKELQIFTCESLKAYFK